MLAVFESTVMRSDNQLLLFSISSLRSRFISPALESMSSSCPVCQLFVCCIAVATFSVISTYIADFSLRLNSLYQAGNRRHLVMQVVLQTQLVQLAVRASECTSTTTTTISLSC